MSWPRLRDEAIAHLPPASRWRLARARAKRLLAETAIFKPPKARLSPHTDWMNECVPRLMDMGKDQDVAVAACLNMWRDDWEESHPGGEDDPGPDRPDPDDDPEEKQLRIARALLAKYEGQPRDHGRFSFGEQPGGDDEGTGSSNVKLTDFAEAGIDLGTLKRDVDWNVEAKARFINQWNTYVKMPPAKFKQDFLGGMKGSMDIMSMSLKNKDAPDTEWLGVSGRLEDENGNDLGEYTRRFMFEKGEAETNRLYLNDGKTGGGIAKKMLAANVAMFKKLGIKKVLTTTDKVGGYAWARYGYVPTSMLEFRQATGIYDKIDKIEDEEDRQWMTRVFEAADPHVIWIMADSKKYGKKLLLNEMWEGVLDFNDEKSMKRFNAYVGNK